MARELLEGNVITSILTIVVICFAFDVKAIPKTGPYDFLMFSLKWPTSFCNNGLKNCEHPIKENFTIHGLWPMYKYIYDATKLHNIDIVPPYNQTGCTQILPMPKHNITHGLLNPIINDMITYWPDIEHLRSWNWREELWQYEWERHGMCFDAPNNPLHYFTVTIDLAKQFDLLGILYAGGIVPINGYGYPLKNISQVLREALGVQATIYCTKKNNYKQLAEIRTCFYRNGTIHSCPMAYSRCKRNQNSEFIHFPTPSQEEGED